MYTDINKILRHKKRTQLTYSDKPGFSVQMGLSHSPLDKLQAVH